jgi:hypothetical protein
VRRPLPARGERLRFRRISRSNPVAALDFELGTTPRIYDNFDGIARLDGMIVSESWCPASDGVDEVKTGYSIA